MFAQNLLLPALAVFGVAAAQSSTVASICSQPTGTISSQADAQAYTQCETVTGSIVVSPEAGGAIDISGPTKVNGDLICHSAGNLITLSSSSIKSIGGSFDLFNLTTLSTLSFTNLTSATTILWNALPALGELTFPQFISHATSVTIENTFLTTLDGINLQSVGSLDINNNRRLSKFSTQVGSVSNILNIASNGQDLQVEFPNLMWANNATFRNVSSVSIPSLATVNGSLIFDENYFDSLSAPNLTTVGNTATGFGSLALVANSALKNITIPHLKTVGGGNQIANNTALQTISFPALTTVGGAIDFSGNFSTPNLPALTNVAGGFNVQSTNVIDCTKFQSEHGNIIQGTFTCDGGNPNPKTLASGTGTSSGSSATSTASATASKGAAVSYGVNEAVAGLSIVGGLLQMLL